MKRYEDYMYSSPMTDGEEMRAFFDKPEKITAEQAREFWRDFMGTVWRDPECKITHGIMSPYLVADHMGITEEKAEAFLWACVEYGITERQGGAFVV